VHKRKGRQIARKCGIASVIEREMNYMLEKYDKGQGDEVD